VAPDTTLVAFPFTGLGDTIIFMTGFFMSERLVLFAFSVLPPISLFLNYTELHGSVVRNLSDEEKKMF
jgi:hypothetical protein